MPNYFQDRALDNNKIWMLYQFKERSTIKMKLNRCEMFTLIWSNHGCPNGIHYKSIDLKGDWLRDQGHVARSFSTVNAL